MAVMLDDERSRQNNHSIDSNYFGIRKPLGCNGGEMIRVGVSQHCTFYSNTVIKNNFFEHCDGETEIISIKSCGNVVRNNVFKECQGAVVLRHRNGESHCRQHMSGCHGRCCGKPAFRAASVKRPCSSANASSNPGQCSFTRLRALLLVRPSTGSPRSSSVQRQSS